MEMILNWLISPLSWVGLKWALPWSVFSLPVGFLSLCSFYTFCHLQAPFFFFSVSLKSIHHLSLVSFTGSFESASFVSCGLYFMRGTHLGTCGLGQRVQHPFHDDIVPHECQSSMILHGGGYHPSVQSIQKSRSAGAGEEKSQQHPAIKNECQFSWVMQCCFIGGGCDKGATWHTVAVHLHEIKRSSHISPQSTSPFVWD